MSPDGASNMRVFIRWHDQTVFAGEEIKCRITFKNTAPAAAQSSPAPAGRPRGSLPSRHSHAHGDRPRHSSPLHASARPKPSSGLAPPQARGHRASLSVTVPPPAPRNRAGSAPWSPQSASGDHAAPNGHRRSISIVSMGSASTADSSHAPSNASVAKPHVPGRGHVRAASLQMSPRRPPTNGPRSASHSHRTFNSQSSPLLNASFPPDRSAFQSRPSGAATAPNTPGIGVASATPDALSDFRFPTVQSPLSETRASPLGLHNESLESPISNLGDMSNLPVRSKGPPVPTINQHHATPAARVLSTTSVAGTPRSSGEFYSLSNNSTETLASEYVTHQPHRTQARPPHLRQRSNFSSPQKAKAPEALMMGYAQIQGSFTLDGSLVDLAPFEQVKRKAVVGGHGGGVIGVESNKRDSGLLRGFGWRNLTSSIGELLGGGELSSIKEMRGIASSKSVPLLSTPQSILFVNLQLGPGESKSFEYSFRLPKGLPPTHKGRAVKIAYGLVIGTQRHGGTKEQQVRSVEIPFRVLGSVNSHGEILGHDLMSPYVILHELAKVRGIDKTSQPHDAQPRGAKGVAGGTLDGFLSYVDELLEKPPYAAGGALLSPTETSSSRRPSALEEATTAREAIDLAIIRSNLTSEGQQSANRFEIARNGRKVGVVMLARPSYRLGESVTMAVDFTGAEVGCYAVHAALETAEKVEPSLALRSEASVHRVTRKVYVSASEATLFARRVIFNPTIPVAATPEFVTSGVSLEWKIRLEFVVAAQDDRGQSDDEEEDEGDDDDEDDDDGDDEAAVGHRDRRLAERTRSGPHPLLEEISRDDRGGLVLVAAENVACESFEVAVPLRVYGAVTTGLERLDRDEALDGGSWSSGALGTYTWHGI